MSRLNLLNRLSKKGRERRAVTTMSDSTRPSSEEKTSSEYPALTSINFPLSGIKRLTLTESPYDKPVEIIRKEEYPHMNNGIYLDHSGTTIYAQSTVKLFAQKMSANLYGNPHSANEPAKFSGDMVDSVREKTLRFLGADPRHFDLVFVANATAAIKLVADCFRDLAEQTRTGSFWYGYHRDAHTSLVGVRELTKGPHSHKCFESDAEVEEWIEGRNTFGQPAGSLALFAYPGQSNLTGRRLPLNWTGRIRHDRTKRLRNTYTLLDAAALAMTSPMSHVFEDPDTAPDFTCVSFYKIFGFPDVGGLIVRKDSGHILALRKYFGGGTVSLVSTIGSAWHVSKGLETNTHEDGSEHVGGLHEGLEDGTLPFHSILALGEAIDVHKELFGSMENISTHTSMLVRRLYQGMKGMRYGNGQPLCTVYHSGDEDLWENGKGDEVYGNARVQGATVAFNVFREDGTYESYAMVEKMANDRGIYVRSGGVCNPGGVFTALHYEPWQLNRAKSAGHHCGSNGLSVINELPTGIVRASLGAMSTTQDVDAFLTFLRENFLEKGLPAKKSNIKRKRQQTQNLFNSISSAATATATTKQGEGTGTMVTLPPSPTPTSFREEGALVMKPKMLERVGSAISV
ncbi:PLP-dependent transferase [Neurospora tetraspora]|uniref:PLP-dependent transferase n=1 Tax=Neurospora tetraspora TaxID=94610 RepID=A0AAE0JR46_9PEZI|nr:PLP-dependent transferase [Neurospora tetraspora]